MTNLIKAIDAVLASTTAFSKKDREDIKGLPARLDMFHVGSSEDLELRYKKVLDALGLQEKPTERFVNKFGDERVMRRAGDKHVYAHAFGTPDGLEDISIRYYNYSAGIYLAE